MHITQLHVQAPELAAQRAFYGSTLGLPLLETSADAFTIQAGKTQLSFQATEQKDVIYHIAFTIPNNKFAQAKTWLQSLSIATIAQNGQDEFPFESWNARSLYFRDAAGNILEFIVHYSLPNVRPGPFGPNDFLYVSEIGLAVEDVPAQVAAFSTALGLEAYRGFSETFTAVGDAHGLFIVVKTGRPWFPTLTRAVLAPVRISISGVQERHPLILPVPYELRIDGR